jgi:hypothetical protein
MAEMSNKHVISMIWLIDMGHILPGAVVNANDAADHRRKVFSVGGRITWRFRPKGLRDPVNRGAERQLIWK